MPAVQQLARFFQANRRTLQFLGLFALIFSVCYFIISLIPAVRESVIRPYTFLLARTVAGIVNLFGAGALAEGSLVATPRYTIDISMGCDGVEASCFFLAGVLAFPTSWRAKLLGLSLGMPLIHLINLGRLIGLYYAGIYLPGLFEEVHVYVAQTLVILLSTIILVFWLERVATRPRSA